jgi:ComF family protein
VIHILKNYFPDCEECGDPSLDLLCSTCFELLKFKNACVECGQLHLAEGLLSCARCQNKNRVWKKLSAAFLYEGGIRHWIHEIKENAKPERIRELTISMLPPFARFDFITPVESDPHRNRRRGYSVASVLAHRLGDLLKIPVLDPIFERTSFISAQKELDEVLRRRYLKNIVSLKANFKMNLAQKRILLVDDIMTTGASLETHSRILEAQGAEIEAFCLARTPKYF